ncbi:hypothetical protein RQP46_003286 [Phenoliferia psychrophenolica]
MLSISVLAMLTALTAATDSIAATCNPTRFSSVAYNVILQTDSRGHWTMVAKSGQWEFQQNGRCATSFTNPAGELYMSAGECDDSSLFNVSCDDCLVLFMANSSPSSAKGCRISPAAAPNNCATAPDPYKGMAIPACDSSNAAQNFDIYQAYPYIGENGDPVAYFPTRSPPSTVDATAAPASPDATTPSPSYTASPTTLPMSPSPVPSTSTLTVSGSSSAANVSSASSASRAASATLISSLPVPSKKVATGGATSVGVTATFLIGTLGAIFA